MNKKIVILIVSLVVLIVIAAVAVIVIPSLLHPKVLPPINPINQQKKTTVITPPTPPSPQQYADQIQKDYPIIVDGVINFLDTKSSYKSTITTADGKVYTLWPAQPESVYKSFGAKSGQKVEVRAKSLNTAKLEWNSMKPI